MKKALRITGGICSIIISAPLTADTISRLPSFFGMLSSSEETKVPLVTALANMLALSNAFLFLFCVAAIVLAILLIANKKPKVMAIILAVLAAGLALIIFTAVVPKIIAGNFFAVGYGFFCVAVFVILIIYLSVKEKPAIDSNQNGQA